MTRTDLNRTPGISAEALAGRTKVLDACAGLAMTVDPTLTKAGALGLINQ
jgi:hypothetical protein